MDRQAPDRVLRAFCRRGVVLDSEDSPKKLLASRLRLCEDQARSLPKVSPSAVVDWKSIRMPFMKSATDCQRESLVSNPAYRFMTPVPANKTEPDAYGTN